MNDPRYRALRSLVRLGDAVLVVGAMVLAYFLHDALRGVVPGLREQVGYRSFLLVGYLTLPVWLAVLVLTGQDRVFERLWSRSSIAFGMLRAHAVSAGLLLAVLWATQIVVNRSVVVLFV